MEKRILAYRRYIDELLIADDSDWEQVAAEHLVQIGFFQHERLIHLIVTVTFAILEMLTVCMIVSEFTLSMCVLALLLLVLLIPYVRHYYILENEVQRMYEQYDKIIEKQGRMRTYFSSGR